MVVHGGVRSPGRSTFMVASLAAKRAASDAARSDPAEQLSISWGVNTRSR